MSMGHPVGWSEGRESIPKDAWGRMNRAERAAVPRLPALSYGSAAEGFPPYGSGYPRPPPRGSCPRFPTHRRLKLERRVGGGGVVLCAECYAQRKHGAKGFRLRRVVLGVLV